MSSNTKKRSALGKGLSALLENSETDITSTSSGDGIVGSISTISISSIEANPFNPRSNFEKEALQELSTSIKIHGIIQPITVRKLGRDKYQLISGERRFRAAQLAKLTEVPAYIRIANDQAMLEMEDENVDPGIVLKEIQPGYFFKDKLLRPSFVAVAKRKEGKYDESIKKKNDSTLEEK